MEYQEIMGKWGAVKGSVTGRMSSFEIAVMKCSVIVCGMSRVGG